MPRPNHRPSGAGDSKKREHQPDYQKQKLRLEAAPLAGKCRSNTRPNSSSSELNIETSHAAVPHCACTSLSDYRTRTEYRMTGGRGGDWRALDVVRTARARFRRRGRAASLALAQGGAGRPRRAASSVSFESGIVSSLGRTDVGASRARLGSGGAQQGARVNSARRAHRASAVRCAAPGPLFRAQTNMIVSEVTARCLAGYHKNGGNAPKPGQQLELAPALASKMQSGHRGYHPRRRRTSNALITAHTRWQGAPMLESAAALLSGVGIGGAPNSCTLTRSCREGIVSVGRHGALAPQDAPCGAQAAASRKEVTRQGFCH